MLQPEDLSILSTVRQEALRILNTSIVNQRNCESQICFNQKISYRQSGKSWKKSDLGPGWFWGTILNVKSMTRLAQKLHIIILLHLGLVTFRIHLKKLRKRIIFMIFRFLDASMGPETNCFWFWRYRDKFK